MTSRLFIPLFFFEFAAQQLDGWANRLIEGREGGGCFFDPNGKPRTPLPFQPEHTQQAGGRGGGRSDFRLHQIRAAVIGPLRPANPVPPLQVGPTAPPATALAALLTDKGFPCTVILPTPAVALRLRVGPGAPLYHGRGGGGVDPSTLSPLTLLTYSGEGERLLNFSGHQPFRPPAPGSSLIFAMSWREEGKARWVGFVLFRPPQAAL